MRGDQSITRIQLDSLDVRSVGYDRETQTLEVELRDLRTFRFFGVPSALYGGFMCSNSHGEFFSRFIKEDFDCQRIF